MELFLYKTVKIYLYKNVHLFRDGTDRETVATVLVEVPTGYVGLVESHIPRNARAVRAERGRPIEAGDAVTKSPRHHLETIGGKEKAVSVDITGN